MINSFTAIGRLAADPELKNGKKSSYCKFTVAVERNFKDNGGNKITDFIPCVTFGKTAEFVAKYFEKGDMIAVTGELHADRVSDNTGTKTYYSVAVQQVSFCERKARFRPSEEPEEQPSEPVFDPVPIDDDLPF